MCDKPNCADFRPDFVWGAATAAFQIEGAGREDGKGPSIWDEFCAIPGRIARGESGDIACDHYHRTAEDIAMMRELGLRAYRFSVSWPRVMPTGRGAVNPLGLDFYDRLVDQLRDAGIEPFVTLYHWDLPAALQTELGGWPNAELPRIFADYAEAVFDKLGDRVRFWVTINEPWCVAHEGYIHGRHAPGITDLAAGYRAAHHLLVGHALAAARFAPLRGRGGQIGLAINTTFSFPASVDARDRQAAERAMLNFAGWFADPVYFGDYPVELRSRLGQLLPAFSEEQTVLLRRSCDFIGLNYYFSDVVRHVDGGGPMELEPVDQPGLPRTAMDWPITPEGLRHILVWLHARYGGPPIYITENGAAFEDEAGGDGFVDDQLRIKYLREHISAARDALEQGVDLRGYFVWSLIDNLEWAAGFDKRFGLIRCDFKSLRRTIKASGLWYADLIAKYAGPRLSSNSTSGVSVKRSNIRDERGLSGAGD